MVLLPIFGIAAMEEAMRQNKAALRAELEGLLANYAGEIHHDADRITLKCPNCHLRLFLPVRFASSRCRRCGATMQAA
jgi:hypothetical protein